jgi:hypothetical protein
MSSDELPTTNNPTPLADILSPPAVPTIPSPAPSGSPLWAVVTIALVCLGLGLGVSFLLRPSAPPSTVSPRPSASASAQATKPEPTQLERAASGESKAMEELNAIAPEQRTIEQMTAIARGRAVEKKMALDHIRKTLATSVEKEDLKRLVKFAQDGDTAREAVTIMAALPGSQGVDLLYDLVNTKGTPADIGLLASQFLASKEVRQKAGPPLSVVFDLRDATECDQRKALLEKAAEVGDRRVVKLLVGLTRKTGCGEKKTDDCNPCLREDNSKVVTDALVKSQKRKAPAI